MDQDSISIIQEYIWNLPAEGDYVVQEWTQCAGWYFKEFWEAETLEDAKRRIIEDYTLNIARVVQICRYCPFGRPLIKRIAFVKGQPDL